MGDHIDPDYAEVGQRCDAHLTTEDGTVFHVNRELLSRHSKFFKSLFLSGEEAGKNSVIRDIKPDIFQIILNYMSTGKVLLTSENVIDILVAADVLMIESLIDECRKFMLREKRVENIVSYIITANRIKWVFLADECRRFLVLCFEKAVMHSMDEVCTLPYEDLVYLLSHKSLNVSNEHTIWSVIKTWIQKDPADRHPHLLGLLRCLSILEISEELGSEILSSPIIQSNQIYTDTPLGCMSDITLPQIVAYFKNKPPIPREVRLPRLLHVVAKNFQDRFGAELFLSYDDSLDLWRKVGEVSYRVARILGSGHIVYCLERALSGQHQLSGFCYNLLRNEQTWMARPHRLDYFVVEVGGIVYTVHISGTSIERYDFETDEWLIGIPSVYESCVSDALSLNGLIYVLGNIGAGYVLLKVYDPARDRWRRLAFPTVRRIVPRSAVYQGKIFLVAGRLDFEDTGEFKHEYFRDDLELVQPPDYVDDMFDDEEDENSDESEDDPAFDKNMEDAMFGIEQDELISKAVEVYDPKSNEWVMYPELPFRFSRVHVSVVKDRLYVYQNPQHPVIYWDGSGRWKIEDDPLPLFQHKFSAVKDEDVVRKLMRRNKKEDLAVWLEAGLENVVP